MSEPANYDEDVSVDTDDERVEGHTFHDGYEVHDIAEAHVKRHLDHMGFEARNWGIDMREDNSVLGDNKLDLKVFDTDLSATPLAGLVEIKTKRNEDWFGTINRHHFRKYLAQAHQHEVPAFVYMSLADEDEQTIVRDTFIPIQPWEELGAVLAGEYDYYPPDSAEQFLIEQVDNHPQIEYTWRAPDGNQVVDLDLDTGVSWPTLTSRLKAVTTDGEGPSL